MLFDLQQSISQQVQFAGLFERSAVLRVDMQRGIVVALGGGHVGGLALCSV